MGTRGGVPTTSGGNNWVAQVLGSIHSPRPPEVAQGWWMARVLRGSPYLIPSQLTECDLEELWWLGDTRNRSRLPELFTLVDSLEELSDLLTRMDSSRATVLRLRYGLDETALSVAEVGDRLGLTREQVCQIESEALSKFKELSLTFPAIGNV